MKAMVIYCLKMLLIIVSYFSLSSCKLDLTDLKNTNTTISPPIEPNPPPNDDKLIYDGPLNTKNSFQIKFTDEFSEMTINKENHLLNIKNASTLCEDEFSISQADIDLIEFQINKLIYVIGNMEI